MPSELTNPENWRHGELEASLPYIQGYAIDRLRTVGAHQFSLEAKLSCLKGQLRNSRFSPPGHSTTAGSEWGKGTTRSGILTIHWRALLTEGEQNEHIDVRSTSGLSSDTYIRQASNQCADHRATTLTSLGSLNRASAAD
ncbi:hypothetical protein LshimejAT787_0406850 [Lyophyllum shimeji]|uniref:Uncharacterized protein n=1 Tax=Lyophyllum shimeji TaxID=47721 RepID=A0A9P3PLI6_LYOSH|nr:hypothetical protein LshimejAT787_0406850 [Lyophyllum shimeji]